MSRCSRSVALEYVRAAVAQKVAHGKAGERGVSYAVVREGGGKRLLRVAVRDKERRLVGLIPALRLSKIPSKIARSHPQNVENRLKFQSKSCLVERLWAVDNTARRAGPAALERIAWGGLGDGALLREDVAAWGEQLRVADEQPRPGRQALDLDLRHAGKVLTELSTRPRSSKPFRRQS